MFFYPRFDSFFEEEPVRRRRRRRRNFYDIDLFNRDPFTDFFEDDDFYPMISFPDYNYRMKNKKKKQKRKKRGKESRSLFLRDFGEGYPKWIREFFGEEDDEKKERIGEDDHDDEKKGIVIENNKEKEKKEEEGKSEKEEKEEFKPITYKRTKTFTSVNGRTESKEVVENSAKGIKKEIISKLIGDKKFTVIKKKDSEGKEEVQKKCEGIETEDEFMKLWEESKKKKAICNSEKNEKKE